MRNFESSIGEKRFGGALSIVRSDGGAMSTEAVAERPIQIALSGPSGGVTGAAYLARQIGVPDVLTFDMGGTSTDVSLVLSGEALIRRDIQLGYFQFKAPAVDVHSVGAGGGSIAFLSASGARSEEHTSELQSRQYLVCRLLLEKKKKNIYDQYPR